MAQPARVALSAILPLPPLEYDVQYMNNVIRILNFFIQQLQRGGPIQGSELNISDRDGDTHLTVNPQELTEVLTIIATNLPTSSTGLAPGQIWNDSGTLKIV